MNAGSNSDIVQQFIEELIDMSPANHHLHLKPMPDDLVNIMTPKRQLEHVKHQRTDIPSPLLLFSSKCPDLICRYEIFR